MVRKLRSDLYRPHEDPSEKRPSRKLTSLSSPKTMVVSKLARSTPLSGNTNLNVNGLPLSAPTRPRFSRRGVGAGARPRVFQSLPLWFFFPLFMVFAFAFWFSRSSSTLHYSPLLFKQYELPVFNAASLDSVQNTEQQQQKQQQQDQLKENTVKQSFPQTDITNNNNHNHNHNNNNNNNDSDNNNNNNNKRIHQHTQPQHHLRQQNQKQKQQKQQITQSKTVQKVNYAVPPISGVVLFHSEYPTLNHTLDTWEKNGLREIVSDFLFFLNGVETRDEFDRLIPRLRDPQWFGKARVITSAKNLPLGLAIREMVRQAKYDFVLLLEKDWALIEPMQEVAYQLSTSIDLIKSGKAHVARFRHRKRPGAPLYAQITYQGRESRILQRQANLFCYMHHWIDDLSSKYDQYFTKCNPESTSSTPDSKNAIWCSKSRYCNWTNNPSLFSKQWFLKQLGDPFAKDYNITVERDPNSHMLDFEFYTNWKHEIWNNMDYIIALPLGLFEHQEVDEQNLMNTVWHAWSRLTTDMHEKHGEYFFVERKGCNSPNKSRTAGVKYSDVFPLDFVHLYHYEHAMQRTVAEAVDELGNEAIQQRDLLQKGRGTWRNGITELTNLWYKTILFTYPLEPEDMKIAFITSVYPTITTTTITTTSIATKAAINLHHLKHYHLIVYTTSEIKPLITQFLTNDRKWTEKDMSKIQFVEEKPRTLVERLLTSEMVNRISDLRSKEEWKTRVSQRSDSGSSTVASDLDIGLNLITPFLLRDAEQKSSGRAGTITTGWDVKQLHHMTHFIWVDSQSSCVVKSGAGLSTSSPSSVNDYVLRGNMLLNTVVTGRRVKSREELDMMLGSMSGFPIDNLLTETEVRNLEQDGLRVVDGRTIGGSRLSITLMAGYYDSVLSDMLMNRGFLGSLREPLTIAHKNVEYNFQFFDAFDACPDGEDCGRVTPLTNSSITAVTSEHGCRFYEWASKCGVEQQR